MKTTAILSCIGIASVSAFAPVQNVSMRQYGFFVMQLVVVHSLSPRHAVIQANKVTSLGATNIQDLPGATAPLKGFDPLNLATLGSESTLAWFRAAELKHSRVAMLATTGYIVQAAGIHFPGMLSSDVSFESLSAMKPLAAWDAVPDLGTSVVIIVLYCTWYHISSSNSLPKGKAQIYFTIFFAEFVSEFSGTHYMKGGDFPTIVFPPINFASSDAEKEKLQMSRELNNGRLAMISIMSFVAAANIPGSVPALAGNPHF